jgi:TetR/AcrR family transcriptional regulator
LKKQRKPHATESLEPNQSTRQAILHTALEVFARDGFDGASLPKIAKLANAAAPLIHYYFGSKENLWRETVDYSLGELRRETVAIRNATRALAPLDQLRAVLQAFTHFAARCPDHFSMIIAEARSDSGRFAWINENYTGILFEEILSILRDAQKKGLIGNFSVDDLGIMMIGGILVKFAFGMNENPDEDLTEQADKYVDLMFNVVMHGIAVKP